MKTSFLNEKKLPLVLEPDERCKSGFGREYLLDLCLNHRDYLQEKLLRHGALLLRSLTVLTAREFAQFVRWFSGKQPLDYVGGASPRIKLGKGVYTSTEYSPHITLALHNELSYTYQWPEHLFFYCVVPPKGGGETSLGSSRAILKKMDAEVLRQFKSRKIRYVRNLCGAVGNGFSWQEAFETAYKGAVENYCRRGGIDFKWKADGGLRLIETRPATATHPLTNNEVWFNQADGFHPSALDRETYEALISTTSEEEFRLNVYYGDGTALDAASLEHVREAIRREGVLVPWQTGDILILDNMLACHGRMPFTGSRKILAAMT